MNRTPPLVVAFFLTAFAHADDSRAEKAHFVKSDNPPFTLEVPSEFEKMPQEWLAARPMAICGFYESDASHPDVPAGIRIIIERLGGRIGEGSSEEDINVMVDSMKRRLPPGAVVTAERVRAIGLELTVLLATLKLADREWTSFSVHVPFRNEAVTIMTLGPAGNEERIKQVAASVLGSVRGETQWAP